MYAVYFIFFSIACILFVDHSKQPGALQFDIMNLAYSAIGNEDDNPDGYVYYKISMATVGLVYIFVYIFAFRTNFLIDRLTAVMLLIL